MVERLFLVVPQGCLQFVIVVFPDHTHLLFLGEIITPNEVNNITKENNYVITRFSDRKMCEDIDNCTNYVGYVDQNIHIQNGYYASPRHLVEEIQQSINFRYGQTLKNSNATISITYGENSAQVKLDVQDHMKVKIIFPKAIAEI